MAKPFEFNIKKLYADLRPSEQKVADYYLGYAGQLEELSLVPMAKAAGVSQPTVMRFVKALGFGGFREFKYAVLKAASGRGNMEADAQPGGRVRRGCAASSGLRLWHIRGGQAGGGSGPGDYQDDFLSGRCA